MHNSHSKCVYRTFSSRELKTTPFTNESNGSIQANKIAGWKRKTIVTWMLAVQIQLHSYGRILRNRLEVEKTERERSSSCTTYKEKMWIIHIFFFYKIRLEIIRNLTHFLNSSELLNNSIMKIIILFTVFQSTKCQESAKNKNTFLINFHLPILKYERAWRFSDEDWWFQMRHSQAH